LSSRSVEDKCDKVEKWYKTKYSCTDFSQELLNKMKSPKLSEDKKKLGIPPPNTLIAKSLDVMPPNKSES